MVLYDVRWIGDAEYGADEWADADGRATEIDAVSPRAAVETWLKLHNRREEWSVAAPDLIAVRPSQTSEWRFSVDDQAKVHEAQQITQVEVGR